MRPARRSWWPASHWCLRCGVPAKARCRSTTSPAAAELFYWIAILCSNTLGTALGDYLADDTGLGFLGGAVLIGGSIALTAAAMRFTRIDRVLLFWIAFVLTRPFGATFGDLLTKPIDRGGLAFGTIGSSAVLAAILVAMVFQVHRRMQRAAISVE